MLWNFEFCPWIMDTISCGAQQPLFQPILLAPLPFPSLLDAQLNHDTEMAHASVGVDGIDGDGSATVLSSFSRSIGLQHHYWAHLKPDTGIHEDPSLIGKEIVQSLPLM